MGRHAMTWGRRQLTLLIVCAAGFATAVLVAGAVAHGFTLRVAAKARVTNVSGRTRIESIVVTGSGHAVYELSADSRRHPKCTRADGCFGLWSPVTVRSKRGLSLAAGIKGRLGTWRRYGRLQLTLGGHPLYTFRNDRRAGTATGEGATGFGGTWHVIRATAAAGGSGTASSPGSTTTTATTTSPTTTTTSTSPPCSQAPCN